METKIEEKKIKVAKRIPPGDRWQPLSNTTIVLDSLTEILEFVYQESGTTKFYMDAKEGFVYTVQSEEVEITPPPPEPPKEWSLYGE